MRLIDNSGGIAQPRNDHRDVLLEGHVNEPLDVAGVPHYLAGGGIRLDLRK
jgi:hypothetical protein